jgi:phosphatidylglycerophosphate synthase
MTMAQRHPGYRQMYASYVRGGYWWTMHVNQRVGAVLAATAVRIGVTPNQLTLLGWLCALATVPLVIWLQQRPLVAGIVAFCGWQLAYSFDCADGQAARALQRTSDFGAHLDLICDYMSHAGVAVTVLVLGHSVLSGAMAGVAGGALTVGLTSLVFYEALAGGVEGTGALRHQGVGVFLRQWADYGIQSAFIAVSITTGNPRIIVGTAIVFAVYNAILVGYRVLHLPSRTGSVSSTAPPRPGK